MMYEVYASTKPGRPTLLLFIVAVALIFALGAAWLQVRATRVLGEEVAIPNTPLIVRPPAGWVAGESGAVFGRLIQKQVWGRRVWAAERTVEFSYNDYFPKLLQMFQAATFSVPLQRKIGEYEAVQYLLRRPTSDGFAETILRWAITPQGSLLSVEYTPLAEVSPGDEELLDDICSAVRLESAATRPSTAALLEHVGVSLPVDSGWQLLGPDRLQGPGFWLLGQKDGRPIWALGVFRHYLGPGGDPMELLLGEARKFKMFNRPRAQRREDGAYMGVVLGAGQGADADGVDSVWVIAKSTVEVAVVYVLSEPKFTDDAKRAAAQVMQDLEFTVEYPQ